MRLHTLHGTFIVMPGKNHPVPERDEQSAQLSLRVPLQASQPAPRHRVQLGPTSRSGFGGFKSITSFVRLLGAVKEISNPLDAIKRKVHHQAHERPADHSQGGIRSESIKASANGAQRNAHNERQDRVKALHDMEDNRFRVRWPMKTLVGGANTRLNQRDANWVSSCIPPTDGYNRGGCQMDTFEGVGKAPGPFWVAS